MKNKKLTGKDFIDEVKRLLRKKFEEKGFGESFSLTCFYSDLSERFEDYKIESRYQHRSIAFALECVIADGESLFKEKEVYLRLFSHPGGAASFCFIETIDREKRFQHFQGKK